MATYRDCPLAPTDTIIYRIPGHNMVYVKPATSYEEALDIAQKEFPETLEGVDRSRIRFYHVTRKSTCTNPPNNANKNGRTEQKRPIVRISECAWPQVVVRLLRNEIIDIELRGSTGERQMDDVQAHCDALPPSPRLQLSSPIIPSRESRTDSRAGAPVLSYRTRSRSRRRSSARDSKVPRKWYSMLS